MFCFVYFPETNKNNRFFDWCSIKFYCSNTWYCFCVGHQAHYRPANVSLPDNIIESRTSEYRSTSMKSTAHNITLATADSFSHNTNRDFASITNSFDVLQSISTVASTFDSFRHNTNRDFASITNSFDVLQSISTVASTFDSFRHSTNRDFASITNSFHVLQSISTVASTFDSFRHSTNRDFVSITNSFDVLQSISTVASTFDSFRHSTNRDFASISFDVLESMSTVQSIAQSIVNPSRSNIVSRHTSIIDSSFGTSGSTKTVSSVNLQSPVSSSWKTANESISDYKTLSTSPTPTLSINFTMSHVYINFTDSVIVPSLSVLFLPASSVIRQERFYNPSCQICHNFNTPSPLFLYSKCLTPVVYEIENVNKRIDVDAIIVIRGHFFSLKATENIVSFGGYLCGVTSATRTVIKCRINTTTEPPMNTLLPLALLVSGLGNAFIITKEKNIVFEACFHVIFTTVWFVRWWHETYYNRSRAESEIHQDLHWCFSMSYYLSRIYKTDMYNPSC